MGASNKIDKPHDIDFQSLTQTNKEDLSDTINQCSLETLQQILNEAEPLSKKRFKKVKQARPSFNP